MAIAFTIPTCVQARVEYPFRERGDFTTKVYHHTMHVKRDNYAPLAWDDVMTAAGEKPVRSPFPDDAAAYYVGDSTPELVDATVYQFDRKFANIPLDNETGIGLYPFTFPGTTTPHYGDEVNATSYTSATPDSGTDEVDLVLPISSADSEKLFIGQSVRVLIADGAEYFEFTPNGGSGTSQWPGPSVQNSIGTVSALSSSSVTITASILAGYSADWTTVGGFAYDDFDIQTVKIPDRDATTLNSAAIQTSQYFKIADSSDLTIPPRFQIVTSANAPTDQLASDTQPSEDQYIAKFENGDYINAEDGKPTRWMGNIWEVSTIKVRLR